MFRRIFLLTLVVLALLAAPAGAAQWKFDVPPGGKLEVDLKTGGKVAVRGGATGGMTVDAEPHGRDAEDIEVTAERTASGVRVHSSYRHTPSHTSGGVDVTVSVPTPYDLDLHSLGGSFTIEETSGKVSGQTMGGGLVLRAVKGHVELSTMGGKVEVTDADCDGKVSTMGGQVAFHNVRGGLQGSTMGGQVTIDGVSQPHRPGGFTAEVSDVATQPVRLSTMGGDIDISYAPAGAEVDTMGGAIHIRSAGGFVKAKTMGGKITLGDVDGSVQATTMGGDVSVKVVGTGGDVELESMSGDLDLTLPANFPGTFDVELAYTRNSSRAYEIKSDFPLTQQRSAEWSYSKGSPRKTIAATGTTGGGRFKVRLRTINGDIVIRRGS